MNETTQEIYFSRQDKIRAVAQFGAALATALPQSDESERRLAAVVRSNFCAECVQCGSRVTGEELLSVSDTHESEPASGNINRMRVGRCVRQDCDALSYRLIFYRHSGVNWRAVFARIQEVTNTDKNAATPGSNIISWLLARRRVLIAVGVLMVLLLIRHWYLGGSIPLIREPEKFRVDPLPPGQTEAAQDVH